MGKRDSDWIFFVAAGTLGSAMIAVSCSLGIVRGYEKPWNTFRSIWLSSDIISLFLVGLVANALAFLGPKPSFTRGPGIFAAAALAAVSFPLIWYLTGEFLVFSYLLSPGLLGMSLIGMGASYFGYSMKRRSNPEAGAAGFFYSLSGIIILITYFNVMFQYGAYLSLGWTYLLPGSIFSCIFYLRVFSREISKRSPAAMRTRA